MWNNILRYGSALIVMGQIQVAVLQAQTISQKESVLVTAVASTAPSITLNWSAFSGATGYTIYRKLKIASSWTQTGTAGSTATQYVDNTAVVGTAYEYKVVRATSSAGTGYGYIASGIQLPVTDYRGKMVLLIESTYASPLAAQLTQLEDDLRADGWVVLRHNVDPWSTIASVKSLVQADYNADPANVKALFLFGHIPVPYSGYLNPDGHGDHLGAWPADGYYGDMNGTWTDNSVTGGSGRNSNVPGDGKFDQSSFPSDLELQVGRVDFQNQGSFGYYSGISVQTLYANYLTKLHNFKTKQFTPTFRGAVFDNFTGVGNALASCGYRSVSANVGTANMSDLNGSGPAFSTYVNNQSYLWTYACGGGGWTSCSNVGTTYEYATLAVNMGGVFNMCLGSYFGDWDVYDNFLVAPLCSGNALTNAFAGLPYWWFHHMGMGDNIGYSTLVSMNNGSAYSPHNSGWQGGSTNRVHMGLMGDPSLRQVMVGMPSNLQITNAAGVANFTWAAASGPPIGYHIYDMGGAATAAPVRLTTSPITGTSWTNAAIPFVAGRKYMVRAVKLETGATGTYYNMSLGAFGTAAGTASPDCLGIAGGSAVVGSACNDNNPNTTNDVYNASCVCAGTATATVRVNIKGILEGPYNTATGLMGDGLRSAGLIPATEPYTALGFTQVGGGGETVSSSVLAVTGNNAIVDWVLVELRSSSSSTVISRTRCGLLQRDGDVVDLDGTSTLTFNGLSAGNYFVALRHRNHQGVMTSAALALSSTPVPVDFSNAATSTYGTAARKAAGAVQALWAGNARRDVEQKYTGSNNDRDVILLKVGGTDPNNTAAGYFVEDVNMNGIVKYTGSGNDRDLILVNVGSTTPTNVRVEQLP